MMPEWSSHEYLMHHQREGSRAHYMVIKVLPIILTYFEHVVQSLLNICHFGVCFLDPHLTATPINYRCTHFRLFGVELMLLQSGMSLYF